VIEEIFSGVHHWTALHKGIGTEVHSYYVPESAALIDPMEPSEGLDWFEEHGRPERILLTNRHHYRHSDRFVEAFGCRVLCHRAGLHEFAGGPDVEGFSFGDDVANGVLALEVAALTPEETAFHIDSAPGKGTTITADIPVPASARSI